MEVHYLKSGTFKAEDFAQPMVMALGFFDGVHRGHQQVINTARKFAQEKQLPLAVMTFDRHSSMLFTDPETTEFRYLNTLDEKIRLMGHQQVDQLFVVEFSRDFAGLSPETFVQQYLVDLQVQVAVAGFDFTFGKFGLGNMELLEQLSQGQFLTITVPKKDELAEKISSTRIRKVIELGEMDAAVRLLGHEYVVTGQLQADGTVTITNRYQQLPPQGEYTCQIEIDGEVHQSLIAVKEPDVQPVPQNLWVDLSAFSAESLKNYTEVKLTWLGQANSYQEVLPTDQAESC
ncbi:hypothetical protein LPAF129_08490 [Ligilactobacillus pabuli]|uniref:FAD synthase n=1 Tax=Ligilactobacillus pabuli TaxID=2886039 RepID=A0ABQ5JH22_9LACO|nr:FAD synthetase family protein [Ligilactobacillus pabuli]GKS81163.1 hypothetical protein LPAF129_08490 [Ligilactobacillus pabuli]HIW89248.1 FAD synthetase family protein [Candidatus Ligilactobacillus excrementipullorum]